MVKKTWRKRFTALSRTERRNNLRVERVLDGREGEEDGEGKGRRTMPRLS